MKITMKVDMNVDTNAAADKVRKATEEGLKDIVVDIAADAIKGSPVLTGHNRRSIAYKIGSKVTALGVSREGEPDFINWQPNLNELEAAIYSTSGYGGYLETGTAKMPARPYFKPALDKNIKNLSARIKAHL